MSRVLCAGWILAVLAVVSAGAAVAGPVSVTIDDAYIGGVAAKKTSTGHTPLPASSIYYVADRIGTLDEFEVYDMVVTLDGMKLEVVVHSSYFDNVGALGTFMGDLFISNDAYDVPDVRDTYTGDHGTPTGEDFEFALSLDDRSGGSLSGTARLYDVGEGTVELSTTRNGYIYRADQESYFEPDAGATALAEGTWAITTAPGNGDYLTFGVDLTGLGVYDPSVGGLGFAWTMSCSNDRIEGFASVVPEPTSGVLLGAGLVSALLARRRRRSRAA